MSSEGDFQEFADLKSQEQSHVKKSYRKWFGIGTNSRCFDPLGPLLNNHEDSNFGKQCRQIYNKDSFTTDLFESQKSVDVEQFVADLEANEYEYWKLLRTCLNGDCRIFSLHQPLNKSLKSFLYALLKAINPNCVLEDVAMSERNKEGGEVQVGSDGVDNVGGGEVQVRGNRKESDEDRIVKEHRPSLDSSGTKELTVCNDPAVPVVGESAIKASSPHQPQPTQTVKPSPPQPSNNRRRRSNDLPNSPPHNNRVPEFESPVKNPTSKKPKDKNGEREKKDDEQLAQKEYPKSYYHSKAKSNYDSRALNKNSDSQGRRDDFSQRTAHNRRTRF